ncbi:OsmC family peroxiredoxin [Streptococcus suis]|uniref:Peroxiredoxin n=1 Tax=Streptococcus suis TaxID=1307 RepID=A0AAD0P8V7_STRSU|nr:OsmC family protein [Streptococcus suis]AWX95874.1 peroxiredoxin [Streptococcus suis]AWX97869.1 peroxiredoxin [Streptococcus suis]MBM7282213.1 OsmC family protein [Streptococcus suis]MBO4135730.1 OsmC family protein [Streptococcus suis]MBS8056027.1 OsmC family peroxiredoxin [Streptococcus suis]
MYQTTVKGEGLFQAVSQGYGEPVRTFGVTEKGETPVSLVNIGLAACITMCVQGYYASQEGNKTMPVQVSSQLEDRQFEVSIRLAEKVSEEKKAAILAYVEQKCKVKALLSDDISFDIHFGLLEEV